MKARQSRRSLGLTAGLLTAAALAVNAPLALAQQAGSDYSQTEQRSGSPSQAAPTPPSEEIPVRPRPLTPAENHSQQGNASNSTGAEPTASPASADDGSDRPLRPFLDRWHYKMQSCLWGFPSQFKRPPLGYFQYQNAQTEVDNGIATLMTLYQYDFVEGCAQLNLHGRDQLAKIASLLPQNFCPIVIERTPEAPALAEARRAAVLAELAHGPFPIPPIRVVIGPSLGDDLRGVEAQLINNNIMIQTLTRGLSAQSGALGAGQLGGGVGGVGGIGNIGGMGGGIGGIGGGIGGIGGMGGIGGIGGVGGGMGVGIGR